ncbi:methyltransferase, partial [Acidithiobacillus sp. GGI-221]
MMIMSPCHWWRISATEVIPGKNLIIEGDNFDALRALRVSHKEKVRCIYIDPPYNTQKKDFVYNDRFVDKTHRFRHSLWLEFMYQRLTIARDLLSEDGVILVSIDDHEVFRLGMLMDRVFGEENKAGVIVWKNVTDNNPSRVATEHEYVLVYMKNKSSCPPVWKSPDLAVKALMLEKERELLAGYEGLESLQAAYTAWLREHKDQLSPLDR